MATPTPCEDCKASGLPILPVRYVPVPNSVVQKIPGWASGARVTDVSLGPEFHYALRTMRAGYVYLFYSKNARGSNQWECYRVTLDGLLIKQPDPMMASPDPTASFVCHRDGHSNARLHHLVIQKPEKCGPTWIAFSEHKWSGETVREYTANSRLRNARMQTIHPAAMAGGAKHTHGTTATEAALADVIEYAANFSTSSLPHEAKTNVFSKEDGDFDPGRLSRTSTRYPWYQRQGQASDTVKYMQERAKKGDGTSNVPHVLALWDAIGLAHELNGYRNDSAGWLKQYGDERELQITALNAIDGVRKALENKAGGDQKDFQDQQLNNAANWHSSPEMAERRSNAARLPEPRRSNQLQVLDIVDDWAKRQIPLMGYQGRLNVANELPEPQRSQEILRIRSEVDEFSARRSKNYQGNIDHAIATSWPKYQEKLDGGPLNKFRENWNSLVKKTDSVIDQRTQALVNWLESPLFIDTLEDFHPTNGADGVMFEDAVGEAIFGMASSVSGAKKIEQWVAGAKASVKDNLLWRAIALNQEEGITEVDAALKFSTSSSSQTLTTEAWDNVGAQVKWNKLADLYKKGISLYNANLKAGVRPVNTFGLEKLFITVGDAIMKPFAKAVDTVAEKTIQTLLLIRSGATVQAASALVVAQAQLEPVSRARLIQRLNTTKAFVAAEVSAERAALNARWAALKATADIPAASGFTAAKELRLGLIVAVLEVVNLWKISGHISNEPKIRWQLRAAAMATSAACLDVVASAIKGMNGAKDLAISFQVLKVAGGVLSGGASFIGGTLDFGDMWSSGVGGRYGLATLYMIRGVNQYVGGAISIAVAISYAAPLLEKLAVRYAGSVVINTASRVAAWALAARAGLMLTGVGFGVATLAISLAIWYFSDDALQDWCEECAFGKRPQKKRFSAVDEQMKGLEAALMKVM